MSDLQLGLFPAEWPLAGPAGSHPPVTPSPASRLLAELPPATVTRLPARVPGSGADGVALLLGRAVPFRLRRSRRARRLRIVVGRSATVAVVLPARYPLREVEPALAAHARWILRTLERWRARPCVPAPRLSDGAEIRFLGRRLTVRQTAPAGLGEQVRVWLDGGELRVAVPPLHGAGASASLREWLRAEARREIPRRVRELGAALGFEIGRVSVRDQRTKWGACSAAGSLTLNWRLALAPPEVLDYVIVHELCHLRELNHSRRFWALVRSLRPEFERERAWLRAHAATLDV